MPGQFLQEARQDRGEGQEGEEGQEEGQEEEYYTLILLRNKINIYMTSFQEEKRGIIKNILFRVKQNDICLSSQIMKSSGLSVR